MKAAAIVLAPLVIIGMIAFVIWQIPGSNTAGVTEAPFTPIASAADDRKLGGQDLLLEDFTSQGRRQWLITLAKGEILPDKAFLGKIVSVRYNIIGFEAVMSADQLFYPADTAGFIFRGHVRLVSPQLKLSCAELQWSEKTQSFSAIGGYVLNQNNKIIRGERLWATKDFRTMRFYGATSAGGEL
jgi:hypothetical protein